MSDEESAEAVTYEASSQPRVILPPEVVDAIQRMIEAAFVRYDMAHGHLSAADGDAQLQALTT